MSDSLTPDQVPRDRPALPGSSLSDAEVAHLAPQLDAIVGYVEHPAREVDTRAIEPLAHALPVQNVFREDECGESLPRERALANAPAKRDGCFAVPAVLE